MAELETHAASDVAGFKHGAAPGGSVDSDGNRLRAKDGMAGDEGLVPAFVQDGVEAIFGSNFKDGSGGKIVEVDAAFDFGLDDVAVDVIAQVGVGWKQPGISASGGHGRPTVIGRAGLADLQPVNPAYA